MVVLTGAVVMYLNEVKGDEYTGLNAEYASKSFAAGVAAGATAGTVIGILKSLAGGTEATGTVVAKAAAAGGAAGAMYGAYKFKGAGTVGGVFGAASAAAVTSVSVAGNGSAAKDDDNSGFRSSIGSIVLGAEENPFNRETQSLGVYTYDCWKAVLHDDSSGPSSGKMLRDVLCDPRIKQVTVTVNNDSDLPRLVLNNVWNENFLIEYLYLSNTKLAAHAVKI